MRFSTLIPFTLLSLAAAQNDDAAQNDAAVVAGTVWSETDYKGVSKAIGLARCNQLRPPLTNASAGHVRSIKVSNGYDCRTYSLRVGSLQNCFGAVTDYPDSVPNTRGKPPINSIQCFKTQ
ncbi:unnamed protein product [Clonostachys byssicola]|uniref:Uncharacterized protein n=1 Tax=Clonostachys byssicola TaxID=160290 RepID=A0A9N9UDZ1_9HYPO|nr:unnamed protein product [Clonostachys byssicola]